MSKKREVPKADQKEPPWKRSARDAFEDDEAGMRQIQRARPATEVSASDSEASRPPPSRSGTRTRRQGEGKQGGKTEPLRALRGGDTKQQQHKEQASDDEADDSSEEKSRTAPKARLQGGDNGMGRKAREDAPILKATKRKPVKKQRSEDEVDEELSETHKDESEEEESVRKRPQPPPRGRKQVLRQQVQRQPKSEDEDEEEDADQDSEGETDKKRALAPKAPEKGVRQGRPQQSVNGSSKEQSQKEVRKNVTQGEPRKALKGDREEDKDARTMGNKDAGGGQVGASKKRGPPSAAPKVKDPAPEEEDEEELEDVDEDAVEGIKPPGTHSKPQASNLGEEGEEEHTIPSRGSRGSRPEMQGDQGPPIRQQPALPTPVEEREPAPRVPPWQATFTVLVRDRILQNTGVYTKASQLMMPT